MPEGTTAFGYRVSKYDPAHFGPGGYTGPHDIDSDRGPVEAAYLAAVVAFAEESAVTEVAVLTPSVTGFDRPGHPLVALFGPDAVGFHHGASVSLPVAVELVRGMLRDDLWCRLEVPGRFLVHVGYDQYLYVGSWSPCPAAVARTRGLGLFPDGDWPSPYTLVSGDEAAAPIADGAFWERVRGLGTVLLLESVLRRWHRITPSTLEAVRAGLRPGADLEIWPDTRADPAAVLGAARAVLDAGRVARLLWEDAGGRVHDEGVDPREPDEVAACLRGARGAQLIDFDGAVPGSVGCLAWARMPDE